MPSQNQRSPRTLTQPKTELVALPPAPSFSLDEANTIVEIEMQADQLLKYIDKITSFADRACSAAIRQTETAHLIEENRFTEIADLRRTLESQNAKLQEQQLAMVRLEEQSKARIASLELRLSLNEEQRAGEQNRALSNGQQADPNFFQEPSVPITLPETAREDKFGPSAEELAKMKIALAERDRMLQEKNALIRQVENQSRDTIAEVEQRLQQAEEELRSCRAALKEKDAVINATAQKEAEMGNLIRRLSEECTKLSAELHDKTRAFAQAQETSVDSRAEKAIWRRVIARMQEDPQ